MGSMDVSDSASRDNYHVGCFLEELPYQMFGLESSCQCGYLWQCPAGGRFCRGRRERVGRKLKKQWHDNWSAADGERTDRKEGEESESSSRWRLHA
ncbi:hypothetical protein NQZ68_013996 [Dissostichus eleginoides]|nr:hypothetical protein NQZ68_013996 [Dissostichus eleginoides]